MDRQSFWADRASWRLEDKLPEALREITVRVGELKQRREARQRAQAAYDRAVAEEQERAHERAAQGHRGQVLDGQLDGWRRAAEMRSFAEALASRIETADPDTTSPESAADARRWLAWITIEADVTDPLRTLPSWPDMPQLPSYELQKFMRPVRVPDELHYRPTGAL